MSGRAETRDSPPELLSIEEIAARLEAVIGRATADETEIVWLEALHGSVRVRGTRIVESEVQPQRTIMVRVIERGRVGSYRTGAGEVGELLNAVRCATAQSRVREPLSGLPHIPADETPVAADAEVWDSEIARLDGRRAASLVKGLLSKRESARLRWSEARVAVFNSRKVRRSASVTAAEIEVSCGRRPGAGSAVNAARRLGELDAAAVFERARGRHARGGAGELPPLPAAVVVSPQAAIELADFLNRVSFSAKAYYDGTSFLREHLGIQVFDRAFNLRDDGTDAAGLPFPFDLEGTAKRPVDLIRDGAPKTPTLDQRQAAVLGLPPTAHAIGGNDARAENLFLEAAGASEEELLEICGDGIWIGALDRLESLEPGRVRFRGRGHGARRIEDGRLAAPLPDLVWEDSLLRAFSNLLGLGSQTARRLSRDGFLGGISAPAIAIGGVENLSPLA